MIESAISIIVFFFGAVIGSFLNVVILRHRSGRTLGGRSLCFSCGKTLRWNELVPIGSFLTQKGKCAHCRTPISWQYPLVEALTGIVFVLLYAHFSFLLLTTPLLFAVLFVYYAFVLCLLVVLSVYDLKHTVLPDEWTGLFGILAFVGMFFISGYSIIVHIPSSWHLLAGVLLPAPFALVWYFSKGRWMGLGDAKLMIGMGWLLGISAGATAILLSFWIGAAVSLILLLLASVLKMGKITVKTAIPFGPFLVLSTMVVFFCQLDFTSIMSALGRF